MTRSDTGGSISWELSFSGLTGNAGAAHIHTGATGSPGPVVLALCGPCQSPLTGTGNVTDAVLDAIESGTAYVNVHTAANGPGEIRGQLNITASIATNLTARQEVPKPKGNVRRATGSFTAAITKSGSTGSIAWRFGSRGSPAEPTRPTSTSDASDEQARSPSLSADRAETARAAPPPSRQPSWPRWRLAVPT